MATVLNQKVHSGQTIYIKIGGQIVGRAQGLNGRRSFGTQGVYEIGSIMPQEHINLRYEGTATLDRFLVKKQSLNDIGVAPLGEEVLRKNVIDIEVFDKTTGNIVRVYRGCTISDYSEVFKVNAICGENATFQYLTCSDNTDTDSTIVNGVRGDGTYDSDSVTLYA
jgi:hypothetical protein